MYFSVLVVLLGWAALFRSAFLLSYTAAVAIGFHLRVVLAEEPTLAQMHGDEWTSYARHVRRWLGRSSPTSGA